MGIGRIGRIGLFALLALCVLPALAQTYPAKPVRILVPYSVGGGLALNQRRFSVSVTGKWNSQQRLSYVDYLSTNTVDPGTYEYLAPVLRVDTDLAVHLTTAISLFVNAIPRTA